MGNVLAKIVKKSIFSKIKVAGLLWRNALHFLKKFVLHFKI